MNAKLWQEWHTLIRKGNLKNIKKQKNKKKKHKT